MLFMIKESEKKKKLKLLMHNDRWEERRKNLENLYQRMGKILAIVKELDFILRVIGKLVRVFGETVKL